MSTLSNKVLSDQQLDKWCYKYVPGFRGTIDRTQFEQLYKSMPAGSSAIINLDPDYSHGGSHWVALRVSSEAPIVYYKDSFGAVPPADIVAAVSNNPGRGLIYGNRINQKLEQVNCGARAANFLHRMSRAADAKKEIEYFESIET